MKRLKVLLVDDEPETGAALQSWLERCGHEVIYVSGPIEADQVLAGNIFDVILSDIQMPGNGRLEWIERLLRRPCPPPVLLMTGDPKLETAMRAANLAISGYLLKPLNYAETATLLQDLAKHAQHRREALGALDKITRLLAKDAPAVEPATALATQLKNLAQNLSLTIGASSRVSEFKGSQPWHDAIIETIAVLEKTKHSFRSRELGALRHRLERLVPVEAATAKPSPILSVAD